MLKNGSLAPYPTPHEGKRNHGIVPMIHALTFRAIDQNYEKGIQTKESAKQ